jgi:hypothetical protein
MLSAFPALKLLKQQTDFLEGWYECFSVEGYTRAHFLSLKLLIKTQQTRNFVKRYLKDLKMFYDDRPWKKVPLFSGQKFVKIFLGLLGIINGSL